jgi:threonine dehydratase
LLVEPSGAAGLAGAMRLAARTQMANIGVVLTGGNAELAVIARLVAERVSLTRADDEGRRRDNS